MIHSRYRMIAEEQSTSHCRLGNFTCTVLLRGISSPSLQRTDVDEGELFWQTPSKIIALAWPYTSVYCRKSPPSPVVVPPFCFASFSSWAIGSLARRRSIDVLFNTFMNYRHPTKLASSLVRIWVSKQYVITNFLLIVFHDSYSRISVLATKAASRPALVPTSLLQQHLTQHSIYVYFLYVLSIYLCLSKGTEVIVTLNLSVNTLNYDNNNESLLKKECIRIGTIFHGLILDHLANFSLANTEVCLDLEFYINSLILYGRSPASFFPTKFYLRQKYFLCLKMNSRFLVWYFMVGKW